MRDNDGERQSMSSAAPTPALSPRLSQALDALRPMRPVLLPEVVWNRLRRGPEEHGLPPLAREERPADIFVDIVLWGGRRPLTEALQKATGSLLRREVQAANGFTEAEAIGELCYLGARIDSFEAIGPLRELAEHPEVDLARAPSGDSLRLYALRCLVGLLGSHASRIDRTKFRSLFEKALSEPGCALIALTALVGLWPESREDFTRNLPSLDPTLLETNLAVAGFAKSRGAGRAQP